MRTDLTTFGPFPTACSDCGWEGDCSELDTPQDLDLAGGGEIPAGCCPACGSLAFLAPDLTHRRSGQTHVVIAESDAGLDWLRALVAEAFAGAPWSEVEGGMVGRAFVTGDASRDRPSEVIQRVEDERVRAGGIAIHST